jgi:hypothetical protein
MKYEKISFFQMEKWGFCCWNLTNQRKYSSRTFSIDPNTNFQSKVSGYLETGILNCKMDFASLLYIHLVHVMYKQGNNSDAFAIIWAWLLQLRLFRHSYVVRVSGSQLDGVMTSLRRFLSCSATGDSTLEDSPAGIPHTVTFRTQNRIQVSCKLSVIFAWS